MNIGYGCPGLLVTLFLFGNGLPVSVHATVSNVDDFRLACGGHTVSEVPLSNEFRSLSGFTQLPGFSKMPGFPLRQASKLQSSFDRQTDIEVSDSKQGKVIAHREADPIYYEEAAKWLESAKELASQTTIQWTDEKLIRNPFPKPVAKDHLMVSEVILIVSDSKAPLLLVFDASNRPWLYRLPLDPKPFLLRHQLVTP